MKKTITFYGRNIELNLTPISHKEVAKYIRRKLDDTDFYVQKKRDGNYQFYYYNLKDTENARTGYYACMFTIAELQESLD